MSHRTAPLLFHNAHDNKPVILSCGVRLVVSLSTFALADGSATACFLACVSPQPPGGDWSYKAFDSEQFLFLFLNLKAKKQLANVNYGSTFQNQNCYCNHSYCNHSYKHRNTMYASILGYYSVFLSY